MSLSISQSVTAISPGPTTGFLASGGTAPYTYSVLAGGAGGSIGSSSGVYTPPAAVNSNPALAYDTIQVVDSHSPPRSATASILVTNALGLVADIIQNQLSLDNAHIYFWDQKIFQPNDSSLYVVVGVLRDKVFGNSTEHVSTDEGLFANQYCNVMATLSIDLVSRSSEARDRKEEVILALQSDYAQSQMETNSFSIGRLPIGFVNLSVQDGAAIPYRFNINVNIQYTTIKTVSVPYFSTFDQPSVVINQ